MALSKILENSITDGVISAAKLKDFAAAVDLNGVELILDADQDTSITADTDDRIDFKIANVEHFSFSNSSGDTVVKPMVDAKDIIFQQYDGNKILEINDGNFVGIGGNASAPGEIRIYEDTDNGSHYTGFKAGNNTASVAYVLPTADGSASQSLITDGSGTLSWSTISSAADDLTAGDAAINLTTTAGNITIDAQGNDTDIIFKGTDGGADKTFMTIDGSAGGDLFLTGGLIDLKNDGSAVSQIKFYCESSNAHAQTLIGAPHSESATNTLTLPSTGGNSYLLTAASTATVTNKTFTSPKINEDVAVTATATEINLIDGGATVGTTAIADGDGLIINDAGTMRVSTVQTLAAYLDDEITAMPNLTSVGTLTTLTVDDVAVDGKVITMTGSSGDTFVTTVAANGATSLVTTDASAAAAHLQITADGTVDIDSAGVLTLDSGAAINIEPASGSAILLDGTISIDAGVVTGATSVTSTAFVGNLTGTVATATQNSITTATGLTAVGAANTLTTVAGIPFYTGDSGSIYTHDVSGTDDTATSNTAFGITAMDAITTGDSNAAFGNSALGGNTSGEFNTGLGSNALLVNSTGSRNTAVGRAALASNTTAADNTAMGHFSLNANTTGAGNTALGRAAMQANTTGTRNLAIGYTAYDASDTENDNLAIGYAAMTTNTAGGSNNVAIGNYALDALTSGDDNVAIGKDAGTTQTTASSSVFIGSGAGEATTTGSDNTALGKDALKANSTGANNTAVGHNALLTNTTSTNNVAVGDSALKDNTTGSNNTAIGNNALFENTTASDNTAVGVNAMLDNTTGTENVAVGKSALANNTTANENTAIGFAACDANTTGARNTGVGKSALASNSTGSNNTAVGNLALNQVTGDENIGIGYAAGQSITSGVRNVVLGIQAYDASDAENDNMAIGYQAMSTNTAGGTLNLAVGNYALYALTSGDHNIAVGYEALASNTTSGGNCAVGYQALRLNTGANNTAFGTNVLDACTSGNHNSAGGIGSQGKVTTGTFNSSWGRSALQELTEGHKNTAVGNDAGSGVTTGDYNVFLGHESGIAGSPGGNVTTADDQLCLGSNEITNAHVQVDWTVASDKRDKTDVNPIKMGLDFVNKLEPVTYHWDKRVRYVSKEDLKDGSVDLNDVVHDGTHKEDWTDIGFLAQDVEKIEEDYGHKLLDKTNLTTHLTEDGAYGLTYSKFVPILTKAIQELSAKVEAQQNEIDALKNA